MNRGVSKLTVFCILVFYAFNPSTAKGAESLDAVPPTLDSSQGYVRNEIIVKLRPGLADNVNEALAGGFETRQVWSGSLQQLNDKYKLIKAQPLARGFSRSRQSIKELAGKDKSQLNPRERRILQRARRAPRGAAVPDLGGIYKIRFDLDANDSLQEIVEAYRNDPNVEYAELNYIVSAFSTPVDPYYGVQWALNNTGQYYPISGGATDSGTSGADINAPEAWDLHTGSSDVVVAVIDCGVDYTHRDLAGNLWTDANGFFGYDFANDDNDPMDDMGHGTHCAGIIAARGNNTYDVAGVCWNAKIMAVKFLDAYGWGTESGAISAIYYAVNNGADVLSNSWGGGVYSESLEDAINYAYSQGCIFVAAAGNYGTSTPVYPAYYNHVISVAATNSDDNKASFSSWGEWVVLAAPGVDILSLRAKNTDMYLGASGYNPGDRYVPFGDPDATMYIASGTSMACPYVAGACALLLSADPVLTSDGAKEILADTGDPIADGICYSDGRLNLFRAVTAAIQAKSKGYITLGSDYYSCDSNVGVLLIDGDLSGEGTYAVSITTSGGDAETIVLTEKNPPVGIFAGTIQTSAGTLIMGDGILQVTDGDIISVSYYDVNDGTGNSATVTDTAAIDCVPPVISNIQMDVRGPVPIVTFDSNEQTTGEVLCGLTCGGPYNFEGEDAEARTTHTIEVSSLSPYTTYYFIVTANDVAGNQTVDSNAGNCYSFTTSGPGDIYVPQDYPTIREAINRSWNGGRVLVADGVYSGQGNRDIDFKGKAITVRSENGPENCIINCNGTETEPHRGFYFHNNEGNDSVLDGLTITNGWGPNVCSPFGCYPLGGGIYCYSSSPTVTNCILSENSAEGGGGGMYNRDGSSPVVANCTFIGNTAEEYTGGGMYNEDDCDPKVINCIFIKNSALSGGGIYNRSDCNPTVTGCSFNGNSASAEGGGMFDSGSATVTNSTFIGNKAYVGGGMYKHLKGPILSNCLFSKNTSSSDGGGMYNSYCKSAVTNCTFIGNTAGANGGGMFNRGDSPTLTNCIFWGNADNNGMYESAQIDFETGNVSVNYSCVQGWTGILGGTGNIGDDPQFLNETENDCHLPSGSPCIDAGDNTAVPPSVVVDLDNQPRFADDAYTPDTGNGVPPIVDMGAYEGPDRGFYLSTKSVIVPEGGTATFTVAIAADPMGTVEVTVGVESGDPDITVQSGAVLIFDSSNYSTGQTVTLAAANDEDVINGQAAIRVSASGFITAGVSASEWDIDAPAALYVDVDAQGANTGMSWTDAYTNLQEALSVAAALPQVNEIRVAQGKYRPAEPGGNREATFQLINDVIISGGYAGFGTSNPNARDIKIYKTILTGDFNSDDRDISDPCDLPNDPNRDENSYHVVTGSGTDESAVLDGFIITAGNDDRTEGPYLSKIGRGGGMYNDSGSPTLINCTFISNSSNWDGGGMYNAGTSSPILTNCTFSGNMADYQGGGMYNGLGTNPTLSNCAFNGNVSNCYGGGVYIYGTSNQTLTNCTFTSNSAKYFGGGMVIYHCSPMLINCTFNSNTAGIGQYGGGGLCCENEASPTIVNCIFGGNSAGEEGGAIRNTVHSSPTIINCTFSGNFAGQFGGGIWNRGKSNPTIVNCILWENEAPNGPQIAVMEVWDGSDPSTATVSHSDVEDGQGAVYVGPGCTLNWDNSSNIDIDPYFVTGPGGDYYLSQTAAGQVVDSPCVDAGSDTAANLGMNIFTTRTDAVRDGGIVDMGYHYPNSIPNPADIDGDDDVDFVDFAILALQWLESPGVPSADIAPPPDGDGIVNFFDFAVLAESWDQH